MEAKSLFLKGLVGSVGLGLLTAAAVHPELRAAPVPEWRTRLEALAHSGPAVSASTFEAAPYAPSASGLRGEYLPARMDVEPMPPMPPEESHRDDQTKFAAADQPSEDAPPTWQELRGRAAMAEDTAEVSHDLPSEQQPLAVPDELSGEGFADDATASPPS